jgi:Chromo (CHRromatin Organisation MOdifier) domain
MKIHNVFHVNLLFPYKETEAYGPAYTRPPPDLICNEEEYKVEFIRDARRKRQGQGLQYLMHWKNYPNSNDSWVDHKDLHAPELLRNTTPPLLRLNDQMFKKTVESLPRIPNFQHSNIMSITPTNDSTRGNTPVNDRPSIMGTPYIEYPQRISTPVLQQTVINATQLQAEEAAEAIIVNAERWGMPIARQQERIGQAAVHVAMVVQSALVFNLPTSQAIQMFAPCSPPASINSLPHTSTDTSSPKPLPIPPR